MLFPACCAVCSGVLSFYPATGMCGPKKTTSSPLQKGYFQGDGHLAMVKRLVRGESEHDPYYELVGLVTLEDIVEEILQVGFPFSKQKISGRNQR